MPDHEPLTVEAAIALRSVRQGAPRVAAGQRNLDRPVRWVHASEGAHIASLLKGGELLLVTGMGIGQHAATQRSFVAALDARAVAGIVVELGQVLNTLPPALVDECETRGLPLIELRREVPFVEITEEIHARLVNARLAVLRRADELHSRFTRLLLDGAGPPEIMLALASTIANPVLLEKAGGGILHHAAPPGDETEVLAAWELWQQRPQASVLALAVPAAGQENWGRLIALPTASPLDDFSRVAMERAAALIAVALLRNRAEWLLTAREHGNYLTDLADGRLHPADSAARAFTLGFDPGRGLLLTLAAAAAPGPVPVARDGAPGERYAVAGRSLRREFDARGIASLVGYRSSEGDLLVLLGLANRERRKVLADVAADLVRGVIDREVGQPSPVVAIGPAVREWQGVPAALRQTAEAAALATGAKPRPWHDATVPDVQRLLSGLSRHPMLHEFATARLEPLVENDHDRVAKLVPTLEALVAHGWNNADAARALNLSRQAIYPRLRRIARLLDADLDDPDTRFGLDLALRTLGRT